MNKKAFPITYKSLENSISDFKKTLTNKNFKNESVFVDHQDGSHFIFHDAFIKKFIIDAIDYKDKLYKTEYKVVFSKYIEPQIFFPGDLNIIFQYGEPEENEWEKTKAYRPKIISKPAHDYLKKQGRELSCEDFKCGTIAIIRMSCAYMSLRHAKVEETDDTYYVFTEHSGYYAIKKKDGHVTESTWERK